MKSYKTYQDIM